MKIKAALLLTSTLLIAGCGQKETIREVLVTTPPTQAPELNKFDQYLEFMYAESGQARSWLEDDLLKIGTTVCEVLGNGGTIETLIEVFTANSDGAYDDEMYSAMIAGAVMFLCPEYTDYVKDQLN